MASQEYYSLEGKVKRTVYAIIFQTLVSEITTIEDAEKKRLAKVVKVAIDDAVDKSLEFLVEHEMLRRGKKKEKEGETMISWYLYMIRAEFTNTTIQEKTNAITVIRD